MANNGKNGGMSFPHTVEKMWRTNGKITQNLKKHHQIRL
jgi:hypothetical protein